MASREWLLKRILRKVPCVAVTEYSAGPVESEWLTGIFSSSRLDPAASRTIPRRIRRRIAASALLDGRNRWLDG